MTRLELEWIDEASLRCGDIVLKLMPGMWAAPSTDEVITLFKDPAFVRAYMDRLQGIEVENMVEVGVKHGGSAIFFWHLLRPRRMSLIELNDSAPHLTRYIESRGLGESIHTHFGVDQGDTAALLAIAANDFPSGPIDLVIDDASHVYTPSRATFEALFPLMRAGGLYILEDWRASLLVTRQPDDPDPEPRLDRLIHEILDFSTVNPHIIPAISCNRNFVVIERGEGVLPSTGFSLSRITQYL